MRPDSAKGNLLERAGCGLTGSWSDHARIMVGTVSDWPRTVNDVSCVAAITIFCTGGRVPVTFRTVSPKRRQESLLANS